MNLKGEHMLDIGSHCLLGAKHVMVKACLLCIIPAHGYDEADDDQE